MRRRGTTLVEVLVALGLVGLVAAGAWALLSGLDRRSARLSDYAEALRATALLRAQMTLDLDNAVLPAGGDPVDAFPWDADAQELSFVRTEAENDPIMAPYEPGTEAFSWRLEAVDGGVQLVRTGENSGVQEDPPVIFQEARIRVEDPDDGTPCVVFEGRILLPARGTTPARSLVLKVSRSLRPSRDFQYNPSTPYPRTLLPSPPGAPGVPTGTIRIPLRT